MDPVVIFDSMQEAFKDFQGGMFLGFAAVCYIIIQALRGKFGKNIPYLTKWFESLKKEIKTYVILGFFAVAGALTGAANGEAITFWSVLSGLATGLSAGMLTIGVRNTAKQGMEGIGTLKKKLKENKGK